MELPFAKITGAGNDFIVFDNRDEKLSAERDRGWFREICRRRRSIGADGVILLQNSAAADFHYVHINADGSDASMCGNGSRALALFIFTKNIASESFRFEIGGKLYRASQHGDLITTDFNPPGTPVCDMDIVDEENLTEGGLIDTGVPHFVIFSTAIAEIDVATIGAKYRHHKYFDPEGTNVNFVEIVDMQLLRARTFERGVEDETLACGTGSVASAIIATMRKACRPPITVQQPGGELVINFNKDFSTLTLTGKASLIYEGVLQFNA